MDLVFCMAGLYRRFRAAGYSEAKFLLPWHGRPLLASIVEAMLVGGAFDRVLLVANERDAALRDRILEAVRPSGVGADDLAFIGDTDGQASTAALAVEFLDRRGASTDRRVVFHNIDTLIAGREWNAVGELLTRCDGWIDTFPADTPAYSYVAVDAQQRVTAIREKEVISPHATTGCYAFADRERFRAEAARCGRSGNERYISDVYAAMLAAGADIRAGLPQPQHQTLIFGTPAEYEALTGAR